MEQAAKIKEGVTVFAASPADDISITAAREFISMNEWTAGDVRMGRVDNSIVVITKKEVDIIIKQSV